MLAAVLDTRGSSDLGRVAYATSFVFDVATIGRTAVRVYRLTTNTV